MRKTININLFDTNYAIDEDACKLLEEYLDSIRQHFSQQESGEEIADDIEHRVAELLWEKKSQGVESIDLMTVKTILKQIGNPEQMSEETTANEAAAADETSDKNNVAADESTSDNSKTTAADAEPAKRKLLRDPNDRVLGGVISGMTRHFGGSNPTLWRIILALVTLFFTFHSSIIEWFLPLSINLCIVIAYLICWIAIPEAKADRPSQPKAGETASPVVADAPAAANNNNSNTSSSDGCAKGCFIAAALAAFVIIAIIFFVSSIYTPLFDMILGRDVIIVDDHNPLSFIEGILHNLRTLVIFVILAVLIALYFLLFRTKNGKKAFLFILLGIIGVVAISQFIPQCSSAPRGLMNWNTKTSRTVTLPDGSVCNITRTEIHDGSNTIIREDTVITQLPPDDFAE